MKKYILVLAIGLMLAILPACKRHNVDDPDPNGPSTFNIIVKAVASSSTLYIPKTYNPRVTQIQVQITRASGEPLANKRVIFQQFEEDQVTNSFYGFFNGNDLTTQQVTDSNGMVAVTYSSPGYYPPTVETLIYIKASLIDNSRTEIYDVVPLRLIPESVLPTRTNVIISGTCYRVMKTFTVLLPHVQLTLTATNLDGTALVLVTWSGENGFYKFVVPAGVTDVKISPYKEGYMTWNPTIREYDDVTTDLVNQDFFGGIEGVVVEDTTPPVVLFLSPEHVSSVQHDTNVMLIASATDASGIQRVDFYDNGLLVGTASASPYQFPWIPDAAWVGTTRTLTCVGYDTVGNSDSDWVTVTIY